MKTYVVFRYDDYGLSLHAQDFENHLIKIGSCYDVKMTFGTVPFPERVRFTDSRPERVQAIRSLVEKGLIEVAQHGYCHEVPGSRIMRRFIKGEFNGIGLKKQLRLIRLGKTELEQAFSTEIVTFIPPYNEFNSSTIKALALCDFENLSAGISKPLQNMDVVLNYVPFTTGIETWHEAIDSRDRSLRSKLPGTEVYIFLFHWYNYPISKVEDCMRSVAADPYIEVCTIRELGNILSGCFNVQNYNANYLQRSRMNERQLGYGLNVSSS